MEIVSGNEKLSLLTMNKKYKMRIELEDFTGEKRWAEYSTFSVKPSSDKYRLNVGRYSGNAGSDLQAQHIHVYTSVSFSFFVFIYIISFAPHSSSRPLF